MDMTIAPINQSSVRSSNGKRCLTCLASEVASVNGFLFSVGQCVGEAVRQRQQGFHAGVVHSDQDGAFTRGDKIQRTTVSKRQRLQETKLVAAAAGGRRTSQEALRGPQCPNTQTK